MNTIKEFSILLALVASVLGVAYAAVAMLPTWALVAYVAGWALVGGLLWRNSK